MFRKKFKVIQTFVVTNYLSLFHSCILSFFRAVFLFLPNPRDKLYFGEPRQSKYFLTIGKLYQQQKKGKKD